MQARTIWVVGVALALMGGCGDDDGDDTDTTTMDLGPGDDLGTADADVPDEDGAMPDPGAACRAAVEAREATVSGELPWPIADAAEMTASGGNQALEADYAGKYRDDLANHPGCVPRDSYDANTEFLVSDNEATVPTGSPADIDGYDCAAKEYDQAAEDTSKPIVILVHGNSSSVTTFEEYENASLAGTTITSVGDLSFTVDATVRQQLASALLAEGHRVIGFDARTDLVNTLEDFNSDSSTGNAFRNIDHGWAVPMLQSLIKAVMTENPTRQVALVGHSLGVTVIRDALRRLYNESVAGTAGAVNPFAQTSDVVLLSGANHGVASGGVLCDSFEHMRGTVGCEMGDRTTFVPTYFTEPLNGPSDLFATPCADGSYAYGETDQCGDNLVEYTTVTMVDIPEGGLQDEFVSEESSMLDLDPCVDNVLIELEDFDSSGYFFTGAPGFFAAHFGSARSDVGIALVVEKLSN
ncbi:MAG: alpha/beta hydrolase [Deltaproteobacteria bacterium]|nr:alpha/beta hydrolase [Deltaproteobacteria bacterium]